MTQTAYSSGVICEIPVAVSYEAPRRATPALPDRGTKWVRAPRTKTERVSELRKLVGPRRRIAAVLRRANGRFVVYTESDTSEVARDTSQPDSLK